MGDGWRLGQFRAAFDPPARVDIMAATQTDNLHVMLLF